jgi:hypothetical protein
VVNDWPGGVDRDNFFGHVPRVEWDDEAALTPPGRLPSLIHFLEASGVFDASPTARCTTDPNAPGRGAFSFLQIPSKNFNFFPQRLPKPSIAFQKLQKISANLNLSMGYERMRRKKLASAPIAAGGPNRPPRRAAARPCARRPGGIHVRRCQRPRLVHFVLASPPRAAWWPDEGEHSTELQFPV